jgi:hypothetical protein
MSSVDFP